jgi:thioesterase domain-containing protein
VGLDDNFFEIGGHSLLAARLFGQLDRVFDRSLPLATLFEAPTIRELARFYRGGAEPANRFALVPITSSGSLPPVFAVPGIGGNVLGFADLARELGPELPFFGLQSIGLNGMRDPLESIEEMATQYLREVRQEQSRGPYHLFGACFGSAVAYEMARLLFTAGEQVAFLGLVDPPLLNAAVEPSVLRAPASLKRALALARFVSDRFHLYSNEFRGLGLKERVQFLRDRARLLGQAVQAKDLFRGDRREFFQHRVANTNLRAIRRHKHQPLDGGTMLFEIFVSEPRFDRMPVSTRVAWNALSGTPVTFHRMPGKDSGDMLQGDNAKALAAVLSLRLQHAWRALDTKATGKQR